jgi:hypothetical protein
MDEKKRCPYCGEEILAVAVKCKHCGSAIEGQSAAAQEKPKIRTPFKIMGVIIIVVIAVPVIYNLLNNRSPFGPSFGDDEIKRAEQSIRSEFGKREGVTVLDVQLMKESSRKLSGFVKVKVPLFGEVTKPCSATMGDNSEYMWTCQ